MIIYFELAIITIVFTPTYLHRISLLGQESHCFDQTLGTAPPKTDLQENTHTQRHTVSELVCKHMTTHILSTILSVYCTILSVYCTILSVYYHRTGFNYIV